MRMLLPETVDPLDEGGLAAAYPWPDGPWLRANMVTSVDGVAAGPDGRSGSISGPADRLVLRTLRADADVVLVGAGTVRSERYRAPRRVAGVAERRVAAGRAPTHRIAVVTRSAELDPSLPFLADADPAARPLVLTCASADAGRRARLAEVGEVVEVGDDTVDLTAALAALHSRSLPRVLTEGGPSLLRDLVEAGLLDELDVTISPVLVGGRDSIRMLGGAALTDAPEPWRPVHLLEDDGFLFRRLLR